MASSDSTTKDFLQLPAFRKWVLEPDAASNAFWAEWQQQHPDQAAELKEAVEIVQAIHAGSPIPAHAGEDTWTRIVESIDAAQRSNVVPMARSWKRWLSYAALVAGIAIGAVAAWQFTAVKQVDVHTAMGELRTIELPDHSVVKLNVNSAIHYSNRWPGGKPREVWLNGEAFFTVTHQANNQAFIVHTNDVDIHVVGTEFNVNTRRVQTQVVLNKGVVELTLNGPKAAAGKAPITMKPGDMVTWSATTAALAAKKVDPGDYSSWQARTLHFNEASIPEVIRSLQENIGITIVLTDTSLNSQTFTGSVPLDNVDVFFKTLSRSFDVKIEQTATNEYRIGSN